jgi:hypothetical protein
MMITDETVKIALFWICLVTLVALLILSLLKGSKEWYVVSQPLNPTLYQRPFPDADYQESRLKGEPHFVADSLVDFQPPVSTNKSLVKSDSRMIPEYPVMVPEQPIMKESRFESPPSVSIRNGIRGSDIRALPKVGGSPIKKPLRKPAPIRKSQSPVKKYR